jgi:hypothetical protein
VSAIELSAKWERVKISVLDGRDVLPIGKNSDFDKRIDKAIKAVDWSNLSKPKAEPTIFNKIMSFIKRNFHMIIGFIVGWMIGQVIVYFILHI